MSYSDRYIAYFLRNFNRQEHRIRIQKKNYTGAAVELKCGANPLRLKKEGSKTDQNQPLRTTVAEIELWIDENGPEVMDLYSDNEREYLVLIERSTGTNAWQNIFTGWLEPWQADQPYSRRPYELSLSAVCGLGHLQNLPFVNYDGKQNWKVQPVISTLFQALYQTGYQLPIWASTDLFEQSQLDFSSGYAVPKPGEWGVFTCRKHTRAHQNEDGTPMTCWEVLESYLRGLFTLTQEGGVWKIYQNRKAHSDGVATVQSWMVWPFEGTTPQVQSIPCLFSIGPTGNGKPYATGTLGVQPSKTIWKGVFPYGRAWNELPNGDFSAFNGTTFTGWTPYGLSVGEYLQVGSGTAENPYRLRIVGNTNDNRLKDDNWFLSTTLRIPKTAGVRQVWSFKGRFKNVLTGGAKIAIVARDPTSGVNFYYLQADGSWGFYSDLTKRNGSATRWLTFNNSELDKAAGNGKDRAKTTEGTMDIPEIVQPLNERNLLTGNEWEIGFYLYRGVTLPGFKDAENPAGAYIEYKDLQFTINTFGNGQRSDIESESHTVSYPVEGFARKAEEVPFGLGDGAGFKRYNRLLKPDGVNPTKAWWPLGVMTFPPDPEAGQRLVELALRGLLYQHAHPAQTFEATVRGEPRIFDQIWMEEMNWLGRIIGYEWDVQAADIRLFVIQTFERLGLGDYNSKSQMTTTEGETIAFASGVEPDVPVPGKPKTPFRGSGDIKPLIGTSAPGKFSPSRGLEAIVIVQGRRRLVGGILDKLKKFITG